MARNVLLKLNAGKNIANYNLAECRHIANDVDKTWLKSLSLGNLWREIVNEHSLVVSTSYEDNNDE